MHHGAPFPEYEPGKSRPPLNHPHRDAGKSLIWSVDAIDLGVALGTGHRHLPGQSVDEKRAGVHQRNGWLVAAGVRHRTRTSNSIEPLHYRSDTSLRYPVEPRRPLQARLRGGRSSVGLCWALRAASSRSSSRARAQASTGTSRWSPQFSQWRPFWRPRKTLRMARSLRAVAPAPQSKQMTGLGIMEGRCG